MKAAVASLALFASLQGVLSLAPSRAHVGASCRTRCAAVRAAHTDVLLSELDTVWHLPASQSLARGT